MLKTLCSIFAGTILDGKFVGFKDFPMSPREERKTNSNWSNTEKIGWVLVKTHRDTRTGAFSDRINFVNNITRKFSQAAVETSAAVEVHGLITVLITTVK